MSAFAVVYVTGTLGRRLPTGDFSGLGGKHEYRVAITTDGIDRKTVGPAFDRPRDAYRYADAVDAKLRMGVEA